jgi:hypothetical protein
LWRGGHRSQQKNLYHEVVRRGGGAELHQGTRTDQAEKDERVQRRLFFLRTKCSVDSRKSERMQRGLVQAMYGLVQPNYVWTGHEEQPIKKCCRWGERPSIEGGRRRSHRGEDALRDSSPQG